MRIDRRLLLVALLACIVAAVSSYIHLPNSPVANALNNPGIGYSDINTLFSTYIGGGDGWFDKDLYQKFRDGTKFCPAPYLHYKFEYPPLVGLLWYSSTCLAIQTTFPSNYTSLEFSSLVQRAIYVHYYVHAAALSLSFVALSIVLYRTCRDLGLDWRRSLVFVLLPTSFLYLVYNWDPIAALFTLLGVESYRRGKYGWAGAWLGLAVATKLLPIGVAFVLLYELVQRYLNGDREPLTRFVPSLAILGGGPYLAMLAISVEGFRSFVEHHASWYCENCLSLVLFRDFTSPLHHVFSMVAVPIALMIVACIDIGNDARKLYTASFLAMTGTILFNYVFTPQMMFMIAPLALVALPTTRSLVIYLVADAANFGIMALFFKELEVRKLLAPYLGIEVRWGQFEADSPIQMIACVRNVALLVLWIYLLSIAMSRSSEA